MISITLLCLAIDYINNILYLNVMNLLSMTWSFHCTNIAILLDTIYICLDLQVHFHRSSVTEPEGSPWLYVDTKSSIANAGLLSGTNKVYSDSGNLLASGGSQCLFVPFETKKEAQHLKKHLTINR